MDIWRDFIRFGPQDVDLSRSPLRRSITAQTFVLGAFNPGFTRLPSGNLLMMVRIAEALSQPAVGNVVYAIRWTEAGYVLDAHPLSGVNMTDPRQFWITAHHYKTLALTSLSWLLPVELSSDGERILEVHYERSITPSASCEQYGIEDARISRIGAMWYMTVCAVSAERHGTVLFKSANGLDYERCGLIFDHQNKDVLLFEGKIDGQFHALTRPLGEVYFAYPPDSAHLPGPCIQFAASPDALHWRPRDAPGIRPRKGSTSSMKIGGGTPPILTPQGWLTIYHGVELRGVVGAYRSFWALLDRDEPTRIVRLADDRPLLEGRDDLTEPYKASRYVSDIVFSTGMVADGDDYLVASGEADLACRLTRIPQSVFQ